MLIEQGMSRNLAAVALGLGGVGQVLGRLGYARFAAVTSVRWPHRSASSAPSRLPTAALALAPPVAALLIALGMAPGAGPRHPHARPGHCHHRPLGTGWVRDLNGILTAPALVAAAAAPFRRRHWRTAGRLLGRRSSPGQRRRRRRSLAAAAAPGGGLDSEGVPDD